MTVTLKHFMLSLCALFALCGAAAAETVIDAEFAKAMIDRHADGDEESYTQVMATLDGLSKENLTRLKALIAEDMDTEAGKIVSPVPVERRIAHGLLNVIADRLGVLSYDYVLDGRFLDYAGSGASITYYFFKTIQGKVAEVYTAVSTLKPHYGYSENYEDYVRIFVKAGDPGNPAGYVVKVQRLERQPLEEELAPLHFRGGPDYLDLRPEKMEKQP